MTTLTHRRAQTRDVDEALIASRMASLTAPWIATGRATRQEARLFAAALASEPALASDLAAARAEHLAFQALADEGGVPSQRPLIALFAAIDADDKAAR